MKIFNIYCDESCHLQNDRHKVMILGALWSPSDLSRVISKRIRAIKAKHNLSQSFEIKWTKVSPAKVDFYMDLISYFFEENSLHFRAIIIPDKTKLRHNIFNHDHDTWYYKMYFEMLKVLFSPSDRYHIYLDIKDSKSGEKVENLHDVLCYNAYDFQRQIIQRVQTIRSHESEQLQLADLLIGCILAANKAGEMSEAKRALMEKMRQLSGYCLARTTLIREKKVNLLHWEAVEVNSE